MNATGIARIIEDVLPGARREACGPGRTCILVVDCETGAKVSIGIGNGAVETDEVARALADAYRERSTNSAGPPFQEVFAALAAYGRDGGLLPSSMDDGLFVLLKNRSFPPKTYWDPLRPEMRPLAEVSLGDMTNPTTNANAMRYAGNVFRDVKMGLYSAPLNPRMKSAIMKGFKVNCWSKVESTVPIYRKYAEESLDHSEFVAVVTCKPDIVLGFATLTKFPSVSKFSSKVKLNRKSAALRNKYQVVREGTQREKGGLLYINLLCSRFRFGGILLRQLEGEAWSRMLDYQAIALRAIDSAYSYYASKGFARTRDNVTFYPIYLTKEMGAVYKDPRGEGPPPFEAFEQEAETGYVFFKKLP